MSKTAAAQHRPAAPDGDTNGAVDGARQAQQDEILPLPAALDLRPEQAERAVLGPLLRVAATTTVRPLAEELRIAAAVHVTAAHLGVGTDDVLALLEQLPRPAPGTAAMSLTEEQEAVLTAIGSPTPGAPAVGVLGPEQSAVAAAWLLVRTGRTVAQVADSLGVTTQRIRQRLKARTLLGVHHGGAWVLPAFQFTDDGRELPGWALVCAALPTDVPAITVSHVLTHPSVDLVLDNDPVSPTDWLTGGGDPTPVVALAADILAVA